MALITKISSVLSDIRYKIRPNNAQIQDVSKITKKQSFGYSTMNRLTDPDIMNLGTEYSQEIVENYNEEEEKPSFNFIA